MSINFGFNLARQVSNSFKAFDHDIPTPTAADSPKQQQQQQHRHLHFRDPIAKIPNANLLTRKDKRILTNMLLQDNNNNNDESTMFVLTNPRANDGHCAIHASLSLCDFIGYTQAEIVGRNVGFVEGCFASCDETQQAGIDRVRAAMVLQSHEFVSSYVINFKKSGIPFINHLSVRPLFDTLGNAIFFVFVSEETSLPSELQQQVQSILQANPNDKRNQLTAATLLCRHIKLLLCGLSTRESSSSTRSTNTNTTSTHSSGSSVITGMAIDASESPKIHRSKMLSYSWWHSHHAAGAVHTTNSSTHSPIFTSSVARSDSFSWKKSFSLSRLSFSSA